MKKLLLYVILILLTACSGSRDLMPGEKVLVQTSGEKPAWAKDSKVWERTDREMLYEITLLRRKNLDIARTEADKSLRAEIAKSLTTDIKEKFTQVYKGTNRNMGKIDELLKYAAEVSTVNITITGFRTTDIYWEKYKVGREYGVEYLYDAYVRGAIPLSTYNLVYKKAVQNLVNSNEKELSEIGEQMLNEL